MQFVRFFALAVATAGAAAGASTAPNFLLILSDDQGWSEVSAPMDPQVPESSSAYLETPNIARLMSAGMRFTSGYAPAPLCTPTRRSILGGTSAARSGTEFKNPDWIPAEHLTIPRALKQANPHYRAAHLGKWGEFMISTPEACGYDASDGMTGNVTGGMPASLGVVSGKHEEGPAHFFDNEDPKRTRSVTRRAVTFIREQVAAGHPFYLQVSYYAPHLSVVTSASRLEKYQRKGTPDRGYTEAWAAMLEEMDAGVGALLDTLATLGIDRNTYVFFTSDNGGRGSIPGGDQARTATNAPLSGAKQSLLEGGIRVPFIVTGPGIRAGSVCRIPVVGYDFLPTVHDLAGGLPAQLTPEVDGVSIRPLLRDPSGSGFSRPQEGLMFHRPEHRRSAIRAGEFKLLLRWSNRGLVEATELYNVHEHPTEQGRDLASRHPEVVQSLRDRLLAHLYLVNAERVQP